MSGGSAVQTDTSSLVDLQNLESLFKEESLLQLLVGIRGSAMSFDDKMSLRDLVLEYSQLSDEGKKSIVKQQVLDGITPYQSDFAFLLKTAKPSETSEPKVAIPIVAAVSTSPGHSRPQPTFVSAKVVEVTLDPKPKITTPSVTSESEETVDKTTVEQSETKPDSKPDLVSVTKNTADVPLVLPSDRIKEIKHLVNSRVDNPINLIDADNEVGREYMNSLLEAMKLTAGSGQPGDLDAAMAKLETAYIAVDKLLAAEGKEASTVESVKDPASVPVESEVVVPKEEVKKVPVKKVSEVKPPAAVASESLKSPNPPEVQEPSDSALKIPDEVAPVEPKTEVHEGLYHQPENDIRKPAVSDSTSHMSPLKALTSKFSSGKKSPKTPASTSTQVEIKKAPSKQPSSTQAQSPVTPPVPNASVKSEAPMKPTKEPVQTAVPKPDAKTLPTKLATPKPVAKEKPAAKPAAPAVPAAEKIGLKSVASAETLPDKMSNLKQIMEAEKAMEMKQLSDDLSASEVSSGLSQLLSEWKLFKSSGLLGTGPSSTDHPLYKLLANMPMAAVVSGRFEGATPEIRQSLTDYMNGWRYEQDVIHEMAESFENYLRRVILHILKRQRAQAKA